MSVIQQLKDAGGITTIETLLNEYLIQTAPARIVFSSIGAGLLLSYIYSQLTHKVNHLSIFVQIYSRSRYNKMPYISCKEIVCTEVFLF